MLYKSRKLSYIVLQDWYFIYFRNEPKADKEQKNEDINPKEKNDKERDLDGKSPKEKAGNEKSEKRQDGSDSSTGNMYVYEKLQYTLNL
jgi:hypothetical protein